VLGSLAFVTVLSTAHFLSPRYLFFCHAPLIVLGAWGTDCLLGKIRESRRCITVTSLLIALALVVSLPRILIFRDLEKADWRSAATLLVRESVPGDVVIAGPNSDGVCLFYYVQSHVTETVPQRWEFLDFSDPGMPPPAETVRRLHSMSVPAPRSVFDRVISRHQIEEICSSADRVWFVTSFWGSATRSANLWTHVEEEFQDIATLPGMMPIRICLWEAPLDSPFD
jgi:hypothetical protein